MKRLALLVTAVAACAVPGSPDADATTRAHAANGASSRLTVEEARQAIRRKVYRRARTRGQYIDRFEIPWCKRRSETHVGCRFRMQFDDANLLFTYFCVGGAGVTKDSAGYQVRLWRECGEPAGPADS